MHLSPAALEGAIRLLDQQGLAEAGHYVMRSTCWIRGTVLDRRRGRENFGDKWRRPIVK